MIDIYTGLEITARHQTMSGHIYSAIEQTYDWTNYFKHKIIFCKIFPIVLALFISDDRLNILFLLIYITMKNQRYVKHTCKNNKPLKLVPNMNQK